MNFFSSSSNIKGEEDRHKNDDEELQQEEEQGEEEQTSRDAIPINPGDDVSSLDLSSESGLDSESESDSEFELGEDAVDEGGFLLSAEEREIKAAIQAKKRLGLRNEKQL